MVGAGPLILTGINCVSMIPFTKTIHLFARLV